MMICLSYFQGANPAIARKQVTELSEQFQAALVAYDEGLSDDRVLASAIWRRLFNLDKDANAENIEMVVHFIRHQVRIIIMLSSYLNYIGPHCKNHNFKWPYFILIACKIARF